MIRCGLLLIVWRVWSSSFSSYLQVHRISGGEGCGVVRWDVACI